MTETEEQATPDESTPTGEAVTEEPESSEPGKKGIAGGLAALAVILFKLKALILPALKLLKFGKVFTTAGSMLLTVVIDAQAWGWAYAIGFVMLIFVHEMGHVLAIRSKGMNASAPVFIPFVGALIALKEEPQSAKDEAEIGIAGPILGSIAALVCLLAGKAIGSVLLVRLAYVGCLINLFNLLPILPLDGGRVMAAVSPKIWLIGVVLAIGAIVYTHSLLLVILVILSLSRTWQGLRAKPESLPYYTVPGTTRVQMALVYFGLIACLTFVIMQLHHRPNSARPMRVTQGDSISIVASSPGS